MRSYFDASTLVSLLSDEIGWRGISAFLSEQATETIYSDFGWGEVLSAFGNRVRRGDVPALYGEALVTRSSTYLTRWESVRITSGDIDAATAMVAQFSLGLRLPDAIHIATAARIRATLISTDIRQVRAAATLGIAAINPLHTDRNRL